MDTALYVGLSRQTALRRELETVAHNIANLNTTAFRAERTLFDEAMTKAGPADPVSFVLDRASYTDTSQGALTATGRTFDVAIQGKGWLSVETGDGLRYTRDGRLNLSADGRIVDHADQAVLDDGGAPLFVAPDAREVSIAADGTLTVDGQEAGRIGVFEFDDDQNLIREENGLFRARGEPFPAFDSRLVQGMLEESNVQPILELVRMMELSKAYEGASKGVNQGEELKRDAINRLGRASS